VSEKKRRRKGEDQRAYPKIGYIVDEREKEANIDKWNKHHTLSYV
jgi:hypothetical protein